MAEKRTKLIGIKVNASEYAMIAAGAKEDGTTVARYGRQAILGRAARRRSKPTASQAAWNYRCGKALLRALELERASPRRNEVSEIEIEELLSVIGVE